MKKRVICIFATVLLIGSVCAVRDAKGTEVCSEESRTEADLDIKKHSDAVYEEDGTIKTEVKKQADSKTQHDNEAEIETQVDGTDHFIGQSEVGTQPGIKEEMQTKQSATEMQEDKEGETTTEALAKAEAEARAVAEAQAEVEAVIEGQMQTTSQTESPVIEISRSYIEDCGSESGYWEIIYSDGHVEYVED